ncbi:MAG TPA: NADH-quinone oxidoreductase subunit A [Ignavibacteria bacterium]|nr:NADH-quinone oxidoreductase subunit A [Ignavibacteria bacterium]HAX50297.1 NADH-quinone oxidoreductase subunit A [Bacteroidota bacterium]HRE09875.1 NADH-quinone oxidoreductase subunit A [Ignavibacteria bacterium]HRF66436.1 NADH-quinone oxidoreductase subunit A [Ignavibacteria bacterium]HRJ05388.1 NADH-quinone oxidoreductase subunit A [Ignavibacteria bacterium]
MLESYIPILIMMGGAVAFAIINVLVSKILGPKKPNAEKLSTYESGVEPYGTAHSKFSIKYYMAAMLFIIFDIEIVFMYPWAVTFTGFEGAMLTYALIEMMVFIGLLLIAYFYMLRKGALKWN